MPAVFVRGVPETDAIWIALRAEVADESIAVDLQDPPGSAAALR